MATVHPETYERVVLLPPLPSDQPVRTKYLQFCGGVGVGVGIEVNVGVGVGVFVAFGVGVGVDGYPLGLQDSMQWSEHHRPLGVASTRVTILRRRDNPCSQRHLPLVKTNLNLYVHPPRVSVQCRWVYDSYGASTPLVPRMALCRKKKRAANSCRSMANPSRPWKIQASTSPRRRKFQALI
jgi:hypothetical protein